MTSPSSSLRIAVSVSSSQLYHNDGIYYRNPSCIFLVELLWQLRLVWGCHGNRCCRAGHKGFAIVMETSSTSMHKYQTTTMLEPLLPFCLYAADSDELAVEINIIKNTES